MGLVRLFLSCSVLAIALAGMPSQAESRDIVNLATGTVVLDSRMQYREHLLREALRISEPDYGPYELNMVNALLSRHRALKEVRNGSNINAFVMVYYPEWQDKTHVIKIPTMMGLLSYRLLLVHESNVEAFSNIQSLDELKKFRGGSLKKWSLTELLESQGFNVVKVDTHEALFKMLQAGRIDYLLRGVNEVFPELDAKSLDTENLMLVPGLTVLLPMPQYLYVSRKTPRLAERLLVGLNRLTETDKLRDLVYTYHGEAIERAQLPSRRILYLPNPDVTEDMLHNKQAWWHLRHAAQ